MKDPMQPAPSSAPRTRLVYRHRLLTRVTHWINAAAIIVLLMTGLNIFNAYPRLHWGEIGSIHDAAWLETVGANGRGELRVAGLAVPTTGLIGWSDGQARGFPGWATMPSFRDLGTARNWHLLAAWVLIINGLAYWLFGLLNRHIARDLVPTGQDLAPRSLWRDFVTHLKLRYPRGEDSLHYHPLQKLSYFAVIAVLVPGIVLTGLTMSPTFNAVAPVLLDIFGGRQSARSLHFLFAMALAAFILVHVVQVLLAGPWNEVRSMVTGKWRIEEDRA